jgi:hypothetical protein
MPFVRLGWRGVHTTLMRWTCIARAGDAAVADELGFGVDIVEPAHETTLAPYFTSSETTASTPSIRHC